MGEEAREVLDGGLREIWEEIGIALSKGNDPVVIPPTNPHLLENLSLRVEVLEQWMTRCQDRGVIASD